MKLILLLLLSLPIQTMAKTQDDIELRQSIRKQLILEEKECEDCPKMHPTTLEREVDRIFASEKNRKKREKATPQ